MTQEEWHRLIESGGDEELFEALPELDDDDPVSIVLYADSEICNGGFLQYYGNGIFNAQEHIKLLELMELEPIAALVKSSLSVFPDGIQPIRGEDEIEPIDDLVAELIGGRDKFDALDDVYFKLTNTIVRGVVTYVRLNSDHYWKLKEESL